MYFGIYGYSTPTLSGGTSTAYSVAGGRLGFAMMRLSGTASLPNSSGLSVGNQGGTGKFIQSGGTATVSYAITIGSGTSSTGTYLMSGGQLSNGYNLNIGASGGNGSLIQSNGSVNIPNVGLVIGAGAASASRNRKGDRKLKR